MYNIKFKVGQEVWPVYNTGKYATQKCEVCDGEKYVILRNKRFSCPQCHGRGVIDVTKSYYYVGKPRKVLGIHIREKDKITCEFTPRTYYSSGCYVDQDHVFENESQASEFCKLVNKD